MSEEITEALFEIHYHRAILDTFSSVLGKRFLRMLKPSTRQETWVGFDQGWVYTTLKTDDLYDQLSGAIKSGTSQVQGFHYGYFLQFKVVHTLQRRSHFTPSYFFAPYFRSELFVSSNPNTGLSQHETLYRLAQIEGAFVYYACPLLFDLDKIYDFPDLDTLQIIDVASAPPINSSDSRHFIAFQDLSNVTPVWCSESYRGRGQSASDWIRDETLRPRRRTGPEVPQLIDKIEYVLSEDQDMRVTSPDARKWLPQSFTLVSFSI